MAAANGLEGGGSGPTETLGDPPGGPEAIDGPPATGVENPSAVGLYPDGVRAKRENQVPTLAVLRPRKGPRGVVAGVPQGLVVSRGRGERAPGQAPEKQRI